MAPSVDRREDALDDRSDDTLGTAWDDLRSGDLAAGGVTLPELDILLGLHIALVLKHTIIQRDRHLARML